jgi:hypothetical protein
MHSVNRSADFASPAEAGAGTQVSTSAGTVARDLRAKVERFLTAPYDRQALLLFRRFFVVKTFIWTAIVVDKPIRLVTDASAAITLLIAAVATVLAWSRDRYRVGTGLLLALMVYKNVLIYFPMTAVHHFLEILVFAAFTFLPPTSLADDPERVDGLQARTIQVLLGFAMFYSGLQKIIQGRWLNGETLAYFGLFDDRNSLLTAFLCGGLKVVGRLLGEQVPHVPLVGPSSLALTDFWLPGWVLAYFLVLSWGAVCAETFLPVLVLFKRTRTLGLIGVTATITIVSATAGVFGFTFTGVSCCLLFFPKKTRITFPVMFTLMLVTITVLMTLRVLHRMPYLWM